MRLHVAFALFLVTSTALFAADGNRLAYLEEACNPYYVHRDFPKLITPQWVGEEGVEAVVTLAIDDMREPARYEAFLRPILDRLKKIDGRAAVSIMTCSVRPEDPQLQAWLREGVSLECHTIDHPCPILAGGDLAKAKSTFDRCVDLMASIPGNRPVAFRVPCCDSRNTPSPRFWTEIFNQRTAAGNFLGIDSSVFCLLTPRDETLPRALTTNEAGEERFRRYLPFKNFVNTIEDYPYPYVIGGLCWEFPCVVPSDWEAQHVQRPNNPATVRDLKLALDAVVLKQGVFNLVYHPHGWIRAEQIVELIDHAVAKHGSKVKFLTFRECHERLNRHLLAGVPLRRKDGQDNQVRLLDVDNDGYMDIAIGQKERRITRIWNAQQRRFQETSFPVELHALHDFGVLAPAGAAALASPFGEIHEFENGAWAKRSDDRAVPAHQAYLFELPPAAARAISRLHDLDGDGLCEQLVGSFIGSYSRSEFAFVRRVAWRLPYPPNFDPRAMRLVDVNGDGRDDFLYSDATRFGIWQFEGLARGWATPLLEGERGKSPGPSLPPFSLADGTNNGCWLHSGELWWQNEQTDALPDLVEHRLLASLVAPGKKDEPATDKKPGISAPNAASADKDQNAGLLPLAPVGAARIDITPSVPIRLTGYGARTKESEGVSQKLFAKALAIGGDVAIGRRNADCCSGGEGGERQVAADSAAILITVDNCGVGAPIVAAVRKELAAKAGLAPERIAVCSSHTHCGPMTNGFAPMIFGAPPPADQQAKIDAYTEELTEKLVRVALDALAARRPGRLAWTVGRVGFAKNRRAISNGKWTGFGVMEEGPVDHRVPLLVARDADGKLIAVLANYACHCTTLGGDFNQIHGDWAGVAQEKLEAAHPGAIAMIAIGAGADANPAPRGTLELVNQHGQALADEVTRLLSAGVFQQLDPARLECQLRSIDLPFAPLPSQADYAARVKQPGAAGYHAQHYHDRLARGETLPTSLPYAIGVWNFGDDLAMVHLAGEVVVDYSLRLHAAAPGNRLWINAYTNDVPCYIASKRILAEGGYEADSSMIYYGRPTRLAPECEDKIVAAVAALLPPAYRAAPAAKPPAPPPADRSSELPPPRAAEDSLRAIHVRPGLRVELVAAEPLVVDPVAFDWGPDGRLWVVEMRDYPNGLDGKGAAGGRIKVLTDTNGDGRYDEAQLFLDNIPFPTGVKVWRQGILVTAAPTIFYAADTSGDGQADLKRPLYEGFGEGNQQHRVNGLRWGFDGWLYVGNGDSGGKIKSLLTGQVVDVSGRDLRIQPDSGALETQSGQTQFGRCRDDWGHWFGGNNSNPLWHYVLDDHYLRRNPRLVPPGVRQDVPRVPGAARVYPRSQTLARFNNPQSANHFTSACSPEIYRDTWLGDEYYGNSFVCEPVHNLIHRELVEPSGFSFVSRRADDERESEFLASEDSWFRPAMIRTGPDGALWVADMYRQVIEHPQWIPAEWQARLNLRAGDDRGRIYRIVRADRPAPPAPRLDRVAVADLPAELDASNGPVRDLVQQLLAWAPPVAEHEAALAQLLTTSRRPTTRLSALTALDTLGILRAAHVQTGLRDVHPGVQRQAVRLAERFLDQAPDLARDLLSLVNSPDPQVQLQVAYSLGAWNDPRAAAALAAILLRKPSSPILTAAAFSSVHAGNAAEVVRASLATEGFSLHDPVAARLLALAAAQGDANLLFSALEKFAADSEGQPSAPAFRAAVAVYLALDERRRPELLAQRHYAAIEASARAAFQAAEPPDGATLVAAAPLLGRNERERVADIGRLTRHLQPQSSPELQQALLEALLRIDHPNAYQALFAAWPHLGPASRGLALDALLARDAGVRALLDAAEARQLSAADLDARRREQLAATKDAALRLRAERLLALTPNADRAAVIARLQGLLTMAGNAEQGRGVFAKRCAQCHRLDGIGHLVGPEIAAIKDRSLPALLVALFDPNRAVEDRYRDYAVRLNDGRQASGLIVEETTASVTLLGPEGKRQTLLRSDIESLRATGRSLMPEGLEKDISPAELADLLAFLAGSGPPPKQFPGNLPLLVRPQADGRLALTAASARITGPRIVFEPQYQNLGWWTSPDDQAAWTVELPAAGRYRVTLDFACDRTTAGNTLEIRCGEQKLAFKVPSTGTWDHYREAEIGVLALPAGPSDLVVRASGPVKGAVVDLRAIRLEPARP